MNLKSEVNDNMGVIVVEDEPAPQIENYKERMADVLAMLDA